MVLALVVGTFVSEDLTCIAAGMIAAKGWLNFWLAAWSCSAGIWIGDVTLYWVGVVAAHTRDKWDWARRIASPERMEQGRKLYEKYGVRWVFFSRFLPGTRIPAYVGAGLVRWSFKKYALAMAAAGILWTPILCGFSYFAGRAVLPILEAYQKWFWPIVIGLILLLWVVFQTVVPLCSWKGRQLLKARWRRFWCWEFWPIWAVYPPVVLSLLWQAIRRRSPLLFTCCNPAIPQSGFAMESKGDILDALECPEEDRVRVARYCRLGEQSDDNDRLGAVQSFLSEQALSYPVVLKPDVGERGQGVAVVRSEDEAKCWLDRCHGDAMVQEFIGGKEFGIQWCQEPGEERGEIPSIAGKHPQYLVGDGERTLEQLILSDPRAVLMGRYYLKKFRSQRLEIPEKGEQVSLVEIGTHARGAVFTDERQLLSEELREAFQQVGERYEGFHFGRYDVRAPSEEDLKAGRGIVILELNGVTGEPVHIYQPGYPWRRGITDLCRHWATACQIGAANKGRGARPSSIGGLIRLCWRHRRQKWFEADELSRRTPDHE